MALGSVLLIAILTSFFAKNSVYKKIKPGCSYEPIKFFQNPDHESINIINIFSGYNSKCISEIIPYFENAAEHGDDAANLFLAGVFTEIYPNHKKAMNYVKKCRELFDLGIIESTYFSGGCDAIEINRSIDMAKSLGVSPSYYQIPNHLDYKFFFVGNKKNFLQQLSNYNSASADCLLGMIYQHESAVFDAAKNQKTSLQQSNNFATSLLGDYSKKAEKYFDESAARGFVPAMVLFARSLEQGIGMDKDSTKAAVWFKRAADLKLR
jgi:hypothetical protein